MTYSEKLRDPRWQKRRLEVMQAADFACIICGCKERELHIHHGYYEYGLEPWEYDISTLHCLCSVCHSIATDQLREIKYQLGLLHPKHYSGLMEGLIEFGEFEAIKADFDEAHKDD